MATQYNFSDYIGQTITGFDVDGAANDGANPDVLLFALSDGSASGVTVADTSGGVTLTNAAGTVTLAGVTMTQLSTSNVNFTDGSQLLIGDNTYQTLSDDIAQVGATSVTGGNGDDGIYLLGGSDSAVGGTGDDVIRGGNGDDSIGAAATAATGADTVNGNAGADRIRYDAATSSVRLLGGADDDSIVGGTKADFLNGNLGDDTLTGGAGADTIHGGADDDQINGGADDDVIYGDLGDDSITTTAGDDTISGGAGDDTITATTSTDNVWVNGNAGDDVITGGTGDDTIYGGAGNDTITSDANGGNDAIYGDKGDDSITGIDPDATETASVYGGEGNDTISAVTGTTDGKLVVNGNSGADSITGGDGADTLRGGSDADTITGGDGADSVYGDNGADSLNGGANDGANDVILGGAGADTISASGDFGTDTIYGSAGSSGDSQVDTLNLDLSNAASNAAVIGDFETTDVINVTMEAGEDAADITVTGGGTSPVLVFGNGDSITLANYAGTLGASNLVLTVGGATGGVFAANWNGAATTLTGGTVSDQLIAGDNGDSLNGAGGDDILTGGDGNDTITSGTGSDTVTAGDGNDTVTIEVAGDDAAGGDGADTLVLAPTAAGITFALDNTNIAGFETITLNSGSGGATTLAFGTNYDAGLDSASTIVVNASALVGGETVTITDGGDVANDFSVTGGGDGDLITLDQSTGDNTISGGVGDDTITSFSGNDSLVGGTGADELSSGAGNDTLIGGSGADVLTSSTGNDLFKFATGDTGITEATDDILVDFTEGSDKFSIQGISSSANISFTNLATNFADITALLALLTASNKVIVGTLSGTFTDGTLNGIASTAGTVANGDQILLFKTTGGSSGILYLDGTPGLTAGNFTYAGDFTDYA